MVALVSIFAFTALGAIVPQVLPPLPGGRLVQFVIFFGLKLPFLPVIAAVTFEIQRIFARYCTTGPLRALLWPGFLVQKITTIEPDDAQLEVALASLRATLWREAAADAPAHPRTVLSRRTTRFSPILATRPPARPPRAELPPEHAPEVLPSRRYRGVENLLCSQAVLSDPSRLQKLNKERTELEPVVKWLRAAP